MVLREIPTVDAVLAFGLARPTSEYRRDPAVLWVAHRGATLRPLCSPKRVLCPRQLGPSTGLTGSGLFNRLRVESPILLSETFSLRQVMNEFF